MSKPKRILSWLMLAVLVCVSLPLCSAEFKLDIKEHTLDNGLKVIVLERRHSPTVAAYMFYKVGSVNEVAGITGISHFIEHLMSKGTRTLGTTNYKAEVPLMKEKDALIEEIREESHKKNPDESKLEKLRARFDILEAEHGRYILTNEIDKIYTSAGAEHYNATTHFDHTNYYMSLPKNKFELWCAIESEIMRGPVFREFYSELRVVAEERRTRIEDSPGGALYEQLNAAAYLYHPYGVAVIGSMSDIQNYTRKDVRGYHRFYYAPNRAIVVIVGDVEAKKVFAMMEKYFGGIPRQPDPPRLTSVEPQQRGERRIEVEFDASPQIGIAYHKTNVRHPDQPVFDVLAEIFSSGRTSRLYRKLVEEKQVAVSVYSFAPDRRYPSLYYIFATPRAPHSVVEVEEAIYEEIEKLKDERVSDWELQRAKNRLTAEFFFELRSNEDLASTIGFYATLDALDYMQSVVQKWNAVTAEDIQRVVKKYLVKSNRTVGYIVRKRETTKQGKKHLEQK